MNIQRSFYLLSLLLLSFGTHFALSMPSYVGDQRCQSCHQKEHDLWKGSHHDLAMQKATEKSVLGDFNNTTFTKFDSTSRFFKDDDQFMVNTDGKNGALQDFVISYTFGVYPLQQYMVEFPNGKIQVLDIAWDSRDKLDGGQRWFSLHPDEDIKSDDILHWTGPNLNWNYMCADCHSTNLKKNYSTTEQRYNTQWSAINVSCEACHGPGSDHIVWAKTKDPNKSNGLTISLPKTIKSRWTTNSQHGKPELIHPKNLHANDKEINVCARCHSRRSQLNDDFVPGNNFRDHYLPSLLSDPLYFPDGKIRDEVYVYGSFTQSLMYAKGVRCSDCHDMHSLALKAPDNLVCTQCHLSEKYDTEKHHHHKSQSTGASCISCHMPPKTYMGVDIRHDHSFRIPRPDLATILNIPDACTLCHRDQTSQWAAKNINNWYGKTPIGYQRFADSIQSANQQRSDALIQTYKVLTSTAPSIAKATVISSLANYPSRQTLTTSLQMLRANDADIRRQALTALESFPIQHTLSDIYRMIKDPVKIVRIEAARLLLNVPNDKLPNNDQSLLKEVTNEYYQTLLFNADRPESQLSIASYHQAIGDLEKAENAYKKALSLQPQYVPAYINYANFLQLKNSQAAYNLLQQGLKNIDAAAIHHSLGLWYIRHKQKSKGIPELKKAADTSDNIRFQYVYAVAIADKDIPKAINLLKAILQKHGGRIDVLAAVASYYQQMGDSDNAKKYQNKIDEAMRAR